MKQHVSALLSPKILGVTLLLTIALLLGTTTMLHKGALTVDGVVREDIPSSARIIHVTNLNADGPGSLTEAIMASGPRVIVFDVGGTINLQSTSDVRPTRILSIRNGNVVIAGETAPEPGIHLIGAPLEILTSNVVIRHLNIYTGTKFPYFLSSDAIKIDSFGGTNVHNILIENNAFFWAIDETGELWTDPTNFAIGRIKDVIFRNNIFAEALLAMNQGTSNPQGALHPKGPHSNGFLISHGAQRITFDKNLFASNYRRNPWITGNTSTFLLNNVIFNPDRHAIIFSGGNVYGEPPQPVLGAESTMIGNVCIAGADTSAWLLGDEDGTPKMIFGAPGSVGQNTRLHLDDNVFLTSGLSEIGRDWGVFYDSDDIIIPEDQPVHWKPLSDYTILPSSQVFNAVLQTVGPNPSSSNRPHTKRLLDAVRNGTSRIVNVEADVGGYPLLARTTRSVFSVQSLLPIPPGYLSALINVTTSSSSRSSVASSSATVPPNVTLPAPVGQWIMNSTTLTEDTSGKNNTLSITGTVPKVPDDGAYAASFTGNLSNYLSAAQSPTLNMDGSSYTLSVWFKPSVIDSDLSTMIAKGSEGRFGNVPFQLYRDGNRVHMTMGDKTVQPTLLLPDGTLDPRSGKAWADNLISPTIIEANRWNHVVAWYDTMNDTLNMSVNGETPVSVNAEFTSGYDNITDTAPLFIGKMFGQKPFNGLISHVQMWKTLLTDVQRKSLYQNNIHCQTGAINCTGATRMIDNGETGFYRYGFSAGVGGYKNTVDQKVVRAETEPTTKSALWLMKDADIGTYDIYMTWPASSSRAKNATVEMVVPGTTTRVTATVDQTVAPRADSTLSSGVWQKVGTVTLGSRSSIRVRLLQGTSAVNQNLAADAVLFIKR
jgi:hypothetical protein